MITNFEDITFELTEAEKVLLPHIIKGFAGHTEDNPIRAKEIVATTNLWLLNLGVDVYQLTEPRLRKMVNYIRSTGALPLIATSKGYYVSYSPEVIKSQVKSLRERANSILRCADGLEQFINHSNEQP